MDNDFIGVVMVVGFLLGVFFGVILTIKRIDIQEIKQVENGYYVTINDEIYFKEK